jgi:hypothetical protein
LNFLIYRFWQRLLISALLPSGIGLLLGCDADLFLELHNAKVKTVQEMRGQPARDDQWNHSLRRYLAFWPGLLHHLAHGHA